MNTANTNATAADTSTIATLRERLATWWAALPRESILTWIAGIVAVVVLTVIFVLSIRSRGPEPEPQPAAAQTNPLAPLVARLDALEADVVDLQDRVAELETQRPATLPRPRVSRAPASAAPEPVTEPTAWSAPTDLDRDISAFNATLQEPTK